MFSFGAKSEVRLSTCHKDLQDIMHNAINVSDVDFGIAEGHRSVALQQKYFKEGKSKIDGIKTLGKHNYNPAMAVDIYPFVDGKANYTPEIVTYIAGIIRVVSEILYSSGKITFKIRWGGNWDMDGLILIDQSFDDRPHFELVKYQL